MAALHDQVVEIDGLAFEVLRGGSGEPVMCCSHPHSPEPERSAWYADHTSIVYVMPRGFGLSSPVRSHADVTYIQTVHDVEAVRRALGAPPWVLEGFSGGNVTALLAALTYPDAVAGLVCGFGGASGTRLATDYGEHSMLSPRHPDYQGLLDATTLRSVPREATAFGTEVDAWVEVRSGTWVLVQAGTPRWVWPFGTLSPHQKAQSEEGPSFELSDRLSEIEAPTLVVAGRHDPIIPLDLVREMQEGIRGSELLVLENSAHGVADPDAEVFRRTVLRFLAGVTA